MLKVSLNRLEPTESTLEVHEDVSPDGDQELYQVREGRLNRSLDDLSLSTFNVGGSRLSAPVPADLTRRLVATRQELWTLQERSAKWKDHLKDLEGAVNFRSTLIDGEERRLDQLKANREEVTESLGQIQEEYQRTSAELETLRSSRLQQVHDNDFTRAAILEETQMLRDEQSEVEKELALLRTKKSAIKAFIEESDVIPEEEEAEDSEAEEGDSQLSDAPQEDTPGSWLGKGRGMTVEGLHSTSTPGLMGGRARGRGRASLLDPRPEQEPLRPEGLQKMEAAFQEQLLSLQKAQQQRILEEQEALESQQREVWRQQKEALDQRQKDLARNADLAKELAEAEAAQLLAKTAETKAAQEAASEKARARRKEEQRLEEQQSRKQQLLALQAQCQYMSDAEIRSGGSIRGSIPPKCWFSMVGTNSTWILCPDALPGRRPDLHQVRQRVSRPVPNQNQRLGVRG